MPFCFHKCHYCDFYSIVEPRESATDRHRTFVLALLDEFDRRAAEGGALRPRSVFFGGGTPTLLSMESWDPLLSRLGNAGALQGAAEITVEANPETVTRPLMQHLHGAGINRISVGVQSFQPDLLKQLERWHDPYSVLRAVDMVRGCGIDNVNLDLIFGIPGQTLALLDADLDQALALEPEHLSCYSLIYEPNTPMTMKLRQGRIARTSEQLEREMYAHVMQRLEAAGYEHYEVSSWAKIRRESSDFGQTEQCAVPTPGSPPDACSSRCLHNLLYWHNANWLGFGPSAASHVEGRRWKNEAHLGRYIAGSPTPPTCDHECLPPQRRVGERIMLGLRLRDGVSRDWLEENLSADDQRRETIDHLIEIGMLERTPTHLRLTGDGLFVADSVIAQLL